MTDHELEAVRKHVVRLRAAIDRAKAEHEDQSELPFVSHWPKNCCDAPYVFLTLFRHGCRGMIRRSADTSHFGKDFKKHVWIVIDGVTIDITADQFPGMGDKVIVARQSPWHDNLRLIDVDHPWAPDDEQAFYERHLYWNTTRVALDEILPRYAPPLDEC